MRATEMAAKPYAAETLGEVLTEEQRWSVAWGDEPSPSNARRPPIRFRQPSVIAPSHSGQPTTENCPT